MGAGTHQDRTLDLVAKCLELVSSDVDGEALAAARKADALRSNLGKDWREILAGATARTLDDELSTAGWLAGEVEILQSQVLALQDEIDDLRMREHARSCETDRLRASLDHARDALAGRERTWRRVLGEARDALARERLRRDQTAARLAAMEDVAARGLPPVAGALAPPARTTGTALAALEGVCSVVLEVKPLPRMFTLATLRRAEDAMAWAAETGARYVLVSGGGVTLGALAALKVDPAIETAVLARLDADGGLDLDGYRGLRRSHGVRTLDLAALVVQRDLAHARRPWGVRPLPEGRDFSALRSAAAS